ncbi:MAG TPA: hypothetical protein VK631_18460, partial [Solirubrobacteraceae bacterium]|nr:hypothetical protein [Solirubrobacteraceae bacterium]
MLTLGLAGALAGALAPGAAAQGPGRAYELISPIDKNLGDVLRVPPAADDGSTIPFATTAALDDAAGAQNASYTVARRTATGWMLADANPASLEPPQTLQPSTTIANQFSGDFSAVLVLAAAAFDAGDRDGQRGDLYRIAAGSGAATWLSHGATVPDSAGLTVSLVWASPDLDHVVFSATGTPQLLPGAGSRALYERIGDELRLVGYPPGSATPAANVLAVASNRDRSGLQTVGASGTAVAHGGARPVSDDGRRIFFAAGTGIGAAQLHLREDGVRTLPVSVSERTGSEGTLANARFIAANPQGDVAYFTSATQLTDDAQVGINIYRFSRLEEPGQRLQLITSQGGTISTAIASADGRHLYFVSTAALTAEATAGQRNAYHWTDGQLTLVATVGPDAPGADGAIARVSRDGS